MFRFSASSFFSSPRERGEVANGNASEPTHLDERELGRQLGFDAHDHSVDDVVGIRSLAAAELQLGLDVDQGLGHGDLFCGTCKWFQQTSSSNCN